MVDEAIIDALLPGRPRPGVPVDIWVRGICAVRPGVPGLSENIRVRSILGRFLEHSRVFAFGNGGEPEVWFGSADMMHRNLDRRIEALVRVTDPAHRAALNRLLETGMSDTTSSWHLGPDGELDPARARTRTASRCGNVQEMLIDARRRRRAHALTTRRRPGRTVAAGAVLGALPAGPGRGLPAQPAAAPREQRRARRTPGPSRPKRRRALRRSARRISGTLHTFRPAARPGLGGRLRPELAWLSGTLAREHAYAARLDRLLDALHAPVRLLARGPAQATAADPRHRAAQHGVAPAGRRHAKERAALDRRRGAGRARCWSAS